MTHLSNSSIQYAQMLFRLLLWKYACLGRGQEDKIKYLLRNGTLRDIIPDALPEASLRSRRADLKEIYDMNFTQVGRLNGIFRQEICLDIIDQEPAIKCDKDILERGQGKAISPEGSESAE